MLPPRALPRQVLRVGAGGVAEGAISARCPRAPLVFDRQSTSRTRRAAAADDRQAVQAASELADVLEHGRGPGLAQLRRPRSRRSAAQRTRSRRGPAASQSQRESPIIRPVSEPALSQRGVDQVGVRLRRLDVGRGGPARRRARGRRAGPGSARPPRPGPSSPAPRCPRAASAPRSARARPPAVAPRRSARRRAPPRTRGWSRRADRSRSSPPSAATSWSPPIPMWRWIRHSGRVTSCARNARYHAIAWW